MNLPHPDSPQWGEYLSAAFRKLRMSAKPDPHVDFEMAGAMAMPGDFLPTRVFPMRPDDEQIPGRDDMEEPE